MGRVRKDRCRHEHLQCVRCGKEGRPVILDFSKNRRQSESSEGAQEPRIGGKRPKGLCRPEVPDAFRDRVLIVWSNGKSPKKKKN